MRPTDNFAVGGTDPHQVSRFSDAQLLTLELAAKRGETFTAETALYLIEEIRRLRGRS